MIKQTELLALAYKRYIQEKENRLNAENTFKQSYPAENYDTYRQQFNELCSEMDNNKTVQIFEDLKKSVKETEYKMLIKETTDVILQQNLPEEKKHTWMEVFKHIEEKMVTSDARANTIADKKSKLKIIFDLAGTQYIEDIDDYKAHEIKNKLFKLPRNAINYAEKSINNLLDKDFSKFLSIDTINSYLICASQLFNAAKEYEIKIKNPFKSLKIKKTKEQKRESLNNRYMPFLSSELKKIFNPATYPSPFEFDKFFIPLIAVSQGMRANEICQLTVSDVVKSTKTKYSFVIREDISTGKKTKNTTSNRIIPVSPILEKIGFIDYVKYRKQHDRNGRLFKSCTLDKRGYFSKYISNFFKKYLDTLNIKDKTKVFHSFRHNFRTLCANCNFSTELSNALGGWSSKCVGESYANKFEFRDLYKAMKQINIPELNALIKVYGKKDK